MDRDGYKFTVDDIDINKENKNLQQSIRRTDKFFRKCISSFLDYLLAELEKLEKLSQDEE